MTPICIDFQSHTLTILSSISIIAGVIVQIVAQSSQLFVPTDKQLFWGDEKGRKRCRNWTLVGATLAVLGVVLQFLMSVD